MIHSFAFLIIGQEMFYHGSFHHISSYNLEGFSGDSTQPCYAHAHASTIKPHHLQWGFS